MISNMLRLPEVIKITGLSRSSIYAMIEKEQFPKQVSLGLRAVGWRYTDIEDWITSRTHVGAK
jgi:prophage regulatory protein